MNNNFKLKSASLKHVTTTTNVNSKYNNAKYSLNFTSKVQSFRTLLDEARYLHKDDAKSFVKNLLLSFKKQYVGDDQKMLITAVECLSNDNSRSSLFHHPQLTPEFQQALAIGYIKHFSNSAFTNEKFSFAHFKSWFKECCIENEEKNNKKLNNTLENHLEKHLDRYLNKEYFDNITLFNNNLLTFEIDNNKIHYKLSDLNNPNVEKNKLVKLSDYQLQKITHHPYVSYFTLTQIASLPKLPAQLKAAIQNQIKYLFQTILAKCNYSTFINKRIIESFASGGEILDLSLNPTDKNAENSTNTKANKLKEMLPKELLQFFPNLKELDLENHYIHKLKNELADLNHLIKLNLRGNVFEKIQFRKEHNYVEINPFTWPPNLRELNLSNNRLHTAIIENDNLKRLNLNDNQLINVMIVTASLEEIRAENNKLSEVNITAESLKSAELSTNQFTSMKDIFIKSKNLLELDLYNNKLTEIDGINYFDNLEKLDLGKNKISQLPELKLPKLIILHASYNFLSEIDTKNLKDLKQLTDLNLNNNKITTIIGEFENLTLKNINLSNNLLTTDALHSLKNLTNLETLFLDHNKLTELLPNTLNSKHIDILHLKSNPLNLNNNMIYDKLIDFLGVPIYKFFYQNTQNTEWLKIEGNIAVSINNDMFARLLYTEYLQNALPNHEYDNYYLELLLANKLNNPEILAKLVTRIFDGSISIAKMNQGIEFFTHLSNYSNVPFLALIAKNFDYFIERKDGIKAMVQLFTDELLIQPILNEQIDTTMQKELDQQLVQLIRNKVMEILPKADNNKSIISAKSGEWKSFINEFLIKEIENKLNSNIIDIANIAKLQAKALEAIFACLRSRNYSKELLINCIKATKINLNEEQLNYFANYLHSSHGYLDKIQIECMQKFYKWNPKNPNRKIDAWYQVIRPYIDWEQAIDEHKERFDNNITKDMGKLNDAIIRLIQQNSNDYELRDLYENYILNTLPYRTNANLKELVNSPYLQEKVKQKLALVIRYNQDVDCGNDLLKSPVLIVQNQTTQQDCLLLFPELDYLNSKKEYSLDHLIILDPVTQKIVQNNNTGNNPNLAEKKFDLQTLTQDILEQLNLPVFALRLLYDKINVKAKFGEYLQECGDTLINSNSIALSQEDKLYFNKKIVQIFLNIGFTVDCGNEFNNRLQKAFDDDTFKVEVFDLITSKSVTATNEINLETFITNIESSASINIQALNEVINKCIGYLYSLQHLNKNLIVTENTVNYLFGLIFMHMSGEIGFGLDKNAFTRFRLISTYYLAKAITDKNWHPNAHTEIKSLINKALLTFFVCSGEIVFNLHTQYLAKNNDNPLRPLYNEILSFLNTKIKSNKDKSL